MADNNLKFPPFDLALLLGFIAFRDWRPGCRKALMIAGRLASYLQAPTAARMIRTISSRTTARATQPNRRQKVAATGTGGRILFR